MSFFKHIYKKISQKWYPGTKLVGRQVGIELLSRRISAECTVAAADVKAVLESLSGVMGEYMAMGRSVRLDGIGSFYYQLTARKQGVDTSEEVSARQITGTRIRFVPERRYDQAVTRGTKAHRTLMTTPVEWMDLEKMMAEDDEAAGTSPGTGTGTGTGGTNTGGSGSGTGGTGGGTTPGGDDNPDGIE